MTAKLPPDEKRSRTIAVRVNKADYELISEAAKIDGLTMGSELLHAWKWYMDALEEEQE